MISTSLVRFYLILNIFFIFSEEKCVKSLTTISGVSIKSNNKEICSGDLIFNETFDDFNLKIWAHERTLAGGGVSIHITIHYNSNNSTNN